MLLTASIFPSKEKSEETPSPPAPPSAPSYPNPKFVYTGERIRGVELINVTIVNEGAPGRCVIIANQKGRTIKLWDGELGANMQATVTSMSNLALKTGYYVDEHSMVVTDEIQFAVEITDLVPLLIIGMILGSIITYLIITRNKKKGE